MIDRLEKLIPKGESDNLSCPKIYVVDYKKSTGGEVEINCEQPKEKSVFLDNFPQIEIYYRAFLDNALEIETGNYAKQCECILFPSVYDENNWILLIETKYTNDIKSAFDEEVDYPNAMIKQIISTVKFLRDNDILPQRKRVNAILSFPTLLEDFSETFYARCNPTIEDILYDHRILMRATNSAVIKSEKRIKLINAPSF